MHGGKAMLARPQQQGGSTNQHTRKVAGKSKQTQRVYSSVQGILRTLVQRGIFEETGMPVDTVGLRKMSKSKGPPGGTSGSMSDYQLRIATTRSQSTLPYQLEMDPNLPAAAGSGLRGVRAALRLTKARLYKICVFVSAL